MSITDIPQKLIDKRVSFDESLLSTTLELTKLSYQTKPPKTAKEVMNTFFFFYKNIKEISPPPFDKKPTRGKIIALIVLFIVIFIGVLYFFPKIKEIL